MIRQLGDVAGDPPRLVASQRLGCRSPIIEIDIRELLAAVIGYHEPELAFLNGPRRRESCAAVRSSRQLVRRRAVL
jgi:hypothetical protein